MTGAEVRAMKDEELVIELKRLREKLYTMRVQGVTDKVEDTSQHGKVRRDIARILTETTARRSAATA